MYDDITPLIVTGQLSSFVNNTYIGTIVVITGSGCP